MTNVEKARENGLWVGKEVWDSARFKESGRVIEIRDEGPYLVIVAFGSERTCYTLDRRWVLNSPPTLSDEPYEIPLKINRPKWEPTPGEVVLVRAQHGDAWVAVRLVKYCPGTKFPYWCDMHNWMQCRPFSFELIGSSENPPYEL